MRVRVVTVCCLCVLVFFCTPAFALKPTLVMKEVDGINVPYQNDMPLASYDGLTQPDRTYLDLCGEWRAVRFSADHLLTLADRDKSTIKKLEEEVPGAPGLLFDDSSWEIRQIPGVENPATDRYQDGVWYRHKIAVPADFEGRFVRLVFGAANYVADVWVNGKWVGYHEGGYTPFAFDVTDRLRYGKENLISVRVDNIPWIPRGARGRAALANNHDIVPFATCDWWNYTGITREVFLEASNPVWVVRAEVRSSGEAEDGNIAVTVAVANSGPDRVKTKCLLEVYPLSFNPQSSDYNERLLETSIPRLAKDAQPVRLRGRTYQNVEVQKGNVENVQFEVRIPGVKLWSPDNPALYAMRVVLSDGEPEFWTQFGVRSIVTDKARLLLNGKSIFLAGVARHELFAGEPTFGIRSSIDSPPADTRSDLRNGGNFASGKSYHNAVHKRLLNDFEMILNLNANFIRTGHYPNHPFTYILADRLGLAVWEEIPVYWFGGREFLIQHKQRHIAKQMWQEMIFRDFNRPSVLFFGMCNECSYQQERAMFLRGLHRIADELSPGRLIGQSASGSDPTDATQRECDVLGFTTYHGVFYGSDPYEDTLNALKEAQKAFPDKPIISTEYGYWSEPDLASAEKQTYIAEETFRAFRKTPNVAGACWWCIFDWHTMINEPQTMGIVTMDRTLKKPAYFAIQRLYGSISGKLKCDILSPEDDGLVKGTKSVMAKAYDSGKIKQITWRVDDGEEQSFSSFNKIESTYRVDWDTTREKEGAHYLTATANGAGTIFSRVKVFVDNVNDPPELSLSARDGDIIMREAMVTVFAYDDRDYPLVEYSIKKDSFVALEENESGEYQIRVDATGKKDNSRIPLLVRAADTAGKKAEKKITLVVDNSPGNYIPMEYNHDWISWDENRSDGTGWDFPAEELPDSGAEFVYNSVSAGAIKFRFGDKSDGAKNSVRCRRQKIELPAKQAGRYDALYLLASAESGSISAPLVFWFDDGTKREVEVTCSDWWGATPLYGEEVAVRASHHHEKSGDVLPPCGIYFLTVEIPSENPDKRPKLTAITLPAEGRLKIFAATLK